MDNGRKFEKKEGSKTTYMYGWTSFETGLMQTDMYTPVENRRPEALEEEYGFINTTDIADG